MTASQAERLRSLIGNQPVIPVIRIDDVATAVPMGHALVAGGLPAIEITLRTPDALEAIRRVAEEVPGAVVGAGTILDTAQFEAAEKAGARFIVSPGTTQELIDAARSSAVPFLPGATTASEVMAMREEGYGFLKFFPAEQSGGAPFLKAIAAPIPDMVFCPTGGVSPSNVASYLALPNVVCVGGSWVVPDAAVKAGDWGAIERLSREAASLR
ncbi:2-dehydro-3-deoxy-phosphogluconate aldolase [Aliihoeflea aestuarii]|jgi:2-dehydro-3-deoxyphosphogluconate aldolase / (4S)-4-hydroxy-2-oxoglutarate aldolase|uniref:2-dehydro-3-deoxy-phosphogluconate aldolase n=1 Tax=Aliihoeflea aestuarii TaxID=453840 RepID=UPI0020946B2D|nr:2-dehydro-3-deoxy-phosphogluconate aldolase [Aliihoeflea aestuarii]MCO6393334.1 2-dehydro-3-deoxy-phosphogluconate aldolase [Aliihoeflea aestuarii]